MKPTLTKYIRENLGDSDGRQHAGPFVTISSQYGCGGFDCAEILVRKLIEDNEQPGWTVSHRDIIRQLAEETGLTEEIIEKERLSKPSVVKDFLRTVGKSSIPDGYEIRTKVSHMVRTAAFEGKVVIVGQGGTAATGDLDNGIRVRLEAPRDWRIVRVCRMEKLSKEVAALKVDEDDQRREYMKKIYSQMNPHEPAFDIVIDSSRFTNEQVADIILMGMQQKKMISVESSS